MYPVSAEFKSRVRQAHQIRVRAEVWRSGVFLRSLDIIDGSVDIDARRAQRRTCRVTVPATKPTVSLVPVYNTYRSIRGIVIEWGDSIATWHSVGAFTWAQANYSPTDQQEPEYATYGELATGYASYGALKKVVSYTEETVDDGLIPTSAFSALAPFGNELLLWRGIQIESPQYLVYSNIKGLIIDWGLVQAGLTWGTVDSGLTWAQGNDLPV